MKKISLALATLLAILSPLQSFAYVSDIGVSYTGAPSLDADSNPNYTKMSANGRYIVFQGTNNNLVTGDINGYDVFRRDTVTNTTIKVNVSSTGAQAISNCDDMPLAMTPDGNSIVFGSCANNLVSGDTNDPDQMDLFVRNVLSGTTTRVNVTETGGQSNGGFNESQPVLISPDGQYIVFATTARLDSLDTNGVQDVYLYDVAGGYTVPLSVDTNSNAGNAASYPIAIWGANDGNAKILFSSDATNITLTNGAFTGSDADGMRDLFVRDYLNGQTQMVSLANNGTQLDVNNDNNCLGAPPAGLGFSPDGNYVFRHTTCDSVGDGSNPNGQSRIILTNIQNFSNNLISWGYNGEELISASAGVATSTGGKYVLFNSADNGVVANDGNNAQDVFMRNTLSGTTTMVSVSTGGMPANGASTAIAMTPDGRYVLFTSTASNLVNGDTNGVQDSFVRDMVLGITKRVSVNNVGGQADSTSMPVGISDDGKYVSFWTQASNIVAPGYNPSADAYIQTLYTFGPQDISVNSTATPIITYITGNTSNNTFWSGQFVNGASTSGDTINSFRFEGFTNSTGTVNNSYVSNLSGNVIFSLYDTNNTLVQTGMAGQSGRVLFQNLNRNIVSGQTLGYSIKVDVSPCVTGTVTMRLTGTNITDNRDQTSFGVTTNANSRFITFRSAVGQFTGGQDSRFPGCMLVPYIVPEPVTIPSPPRAFAGGGGGASSYSSSSTSSSASNTSSTPVETMSIPTPGNTIANVAALSDLPSTPGVTIIPVSVSPDSNGVVTNSWVVTTTSNGSQSYVANGFVSRYDTALLLEMLQARYNPSSN